LPWSLKTRGQKPDADGIFENLKTGVALDASVLLQPRPKVSFIASVLKDPKPKA